MAVSVRRSITAIIPILSLLTSCETAPEPKAVRLYSGQHKSCHSLTVSSDPLGAYVYGVGGDYWGITEKDNPVRRNLYHDLFWDPDKKSWYTVSNYSNIWSITLKKRGYKPTVQTFPISGDFRAILSSPEQLIADGHLGTCPDGVETTNVVVVLDPG